MTNVFSLHKVIDHVVSHVPKPNITDVTALAEWTDKDENMKMLLFMSMGNDNLVHLSDSKTAAQMWDNLRAVYKVKGHQTVIALRHSLYHLAANNDNNIPMHLIEMKQMRLRLHQLGCVISELEFYNVLVSVLLRLWDGFISTLLGSWKGANDSGQTQMSLQELFALIKDEYEHWTGRLNRTQNGATGTNMREQAFITKPHGKQC